MKFQNTHLISNEYSNGVTYSNNVPSKNTNISKNRIKNFFLGLLMGFFFSYMIREYIFKVDFCPILQHNSNSRSYPSKFSNKNTAKSKEPKLLYVGVMTANKYIDTRAKSIYETWGNDILGNLEFFSSEYSETQYNIPLIKLKGVDDTYPPQKKSFMMLKYMYDNYINDYEFFLRADDDVYVRTDRIENFLKSINSSKLFFIGQAGRGTKDEFGKLSLNYNDNFCMGGPGMIFSRATLKKFGPHIKECLKNLNSFHEDVEIGRCVKKHVGIPCTWSYEMRNIFYHRSGGDEAFSGSLNQDEIHRAITLHPLKESHQAQRLHIYLKSSIIREKELELVTTLKEFKRFFQIINKPLPPLNDVSKGVFLEHLVSETSLNQWKPQNLSDVIPWDFVKRNVYRIGDSNPRHALDAPTNSSIREVVRNLMENINRLSKERGRILEFKEVLYGYLRHNPLYSSDFILDLSLVYKKYKGKKMTVPVRRHVYIQNAFGPLYVREVPPKEVEAGGNHRSLSRMLRDVLGRVAGLDRSPEGVSTSDERVTFIVPLAGRLSTLRRFLVGYEKVCLEVQQNVRLILVSFRSTSDASDSKDHIEKLLNRLRKHYPVASIDAIWSNEAFSRGLALDLGASSCSPDDLLFFVDVDMSFTPETIQKVQMHTIQGTQVYFPIVFSQFDPKYLIKNANSSGESPMLDPSVIDENSGYWRFFGYGMLSVYLSDLYSIGGFNKSIRGWGKEDVDLYEKVIKHPKLRAFRAPDPSLVHVYHPVLCDPSLQPDQLKMCRGSQLKSFASLGTLVKLLSNSSRSSVRPSSIPSSGTKL